MIRSTAETVMRKLEVASRFAIRGDFRLGTVTYLSPEIAR